jgi:hypothetical protein
MMKFRCLPNFWNRLQGIATRGNQITVGSALYQTRDTRA